MHPVERVLAPARRLLLRNPWHVGAACFAAGLALAPLDGSAVLACASVVAAVVAVLGSPRLALVTAGLLLAGGGLGELRLAALDSLLPRIRDGGPVESRAHLLAHPRPSPFGASAELRLAGGELDGARLLGRVPRWVRFPRAHAIGDELEVEGTLRRLRPSDQDPFAAQLRRRGFAGELMLERVRATGRRRGGPAGAVDRLRTPAERTVAAGLDSAEAALLRGMVLGQDEAISRPVRDDWRDSGLAHLLAVSGQNVMLLVALALPALATAGLSAPARLWALLALVAVYVPLAGAGPSLQRAGVMGAAGIAALVASRPASRAYALVLAAAATLALNPRACGDPGWQLSFAAVAGIAWLGAPLSRSLRAAAGELGLGSRGQRDSAPGRVAAALADGIALTLAATLATAPLLGHHFGTVPVAGLGANLLALPAVAPVMWLGMLKAALGPPASLGGPAGELAEAAAGALGAPSGIALEYLGWVAERFADLPGGQLSLPLQSPLSMAVAYGLLIGAALALRRAAAPLPSRAAEMAGRWRRLPRGRRVALTALAATAALLVAAPAVAPPRPPGALTVRFLDVGQGDATLVQHPDGTAILFDGGPPEAGTASLLRKAGVRRLALVVATHASRDHHGGLAEVIEELPVDVLLDGGDGTGDPAFRDVVATARRRGVRIRPALAPLALRAGALSIHVLSPPPRAPGPPPEDPNPRAVVAVVSTGGFDLLLSADAESETLEPLHLPDVEAMKVPHHGSADPGLPAVLDELKPELAAIEVGPNTYGHPTASTLEALRAAGARTYRTDHHGTISMTVENGGIRVSTER